MHNVPPAGQTSKTASTTERYFSDALKGRTREPAPLQWATTQNLGNALSTLGQRKSDMGGVVDCRRVCLAA